MEMFHCPLVELRDRFTASELVILGWVSQERSYKMNVRMNHGQESDDSDRPTYQPKPKGGKPSGGTYRREYEDADIPAGLPDEFFDEEGGVNLSKVKLKDAVKYMNAIGINMPMPMPSKNMGNTRLVNKEELPKMDDLFPDK